jgi:predicted kinase
MDLEEDQAGTRTVFRKQSIGECISLTQLIMVTRGLPGSGKSTWADHFCKVSKRSLKIERDEMRLLLFKQLGKLEQEQEEEVTRVQESLIRSHLAAGLTVVISDTNLPDRSVKRWLKLGHELGIPVLVEDFRHIPLEEVLKNNAARNQWSGKQVPEEVIRDMHKRFIKGRDLTKEITYTPPAELEVEPYRQPTDWNAPEAVIFDIDGTLADMGDRRSPYDPTKYHLDTLNTDVHDSLVAHHSWGRDIIIVSGRDEAYRSETLAWLNDNDVKWDFLYMRPTEEGKKREDSIIKYELFQKHIAPSRYKIVGVYDDRQRVLRMWRKLGLTTFHVNGPDAGNF